MAMGYPNCCSNRRNNQLFLVRKGRRRSGWSCGIRNRMCSSNISDFYRGCRNNNSAKNSILAFQLNTPEQKQNE